MALPHFVCKWLQILFTPLKGVLFTFPSRYLFTIGSRVVFSLIPWSGRIHAEFHLHRITWDSTSGLTHFAYVAFTPCGRSFQNVQLAFSLIYWWSLYPERINPPGLGSSAFARHYLRNHCHFLFLGLLRCFTSPRSPSWTMNSSRNDSTLLLPDCSIRKSADRYLFAVTRSFSQLTTSFFASRLLGIHHLHLVA